eukprot:39192-Eustigmatos_ZCMA.PRE.1
MNSIYSQDMPDGRCRDEHPLFTASPPDWTLCVHHRTTCSDPLSPDQMFPMACTTSSRPRHVTAK